jgi:hypothetical protein
MKSLFDMHIGMDIRLNTLQNFVLFSSQIYSVDTPNPAGDLGTETARSYIPYLHLGSTESTLPLVLYSCSSQARSSSLMVTYTLLRLAPSHD